MTKEQYKNYFMDITLNLYLGNWQAAGETLRELRKNEGLTQKELGLLAQGVKQNHISNMEKGKVAVFPKILNWVAQKIQG